MIWYSKSFFLSKKWIFKIEVVDKLRNFFTNDLLFIFNYIDICCDNMPNYSISATVKTKIRCML